MYNMKKLQGSLSPHWKGCGAVSGTKWHLNFPDFDYSQFVPKLSKEEIIKKASKC